MLKVWIIFKKSHYNLFYSFSINKYFKQQISWYNENDIIFVMAPIYELVNGGITLKKLRRG